jgi:hypothetical protein
VVFVGLQRMFPVLVAANTGQGRAATVPLRGPCW